MIRKASEKSPHNVDEQAQANRQSGALESLRYEEDYQAALGRMLVRFNEVEIMVGNILRSTLDKLGKPHLFKVDEYFRQKIDKLELAVCAFPTWPKVDFERLRRINNWRNNLTHGHFHKDPNSGEWQTRRVHRKRSKPETITPDEISRWTDEVRLAYGDVGQLLPWVWFDDPDGGQSLPEGVRAKPIDP